MNTVEEEKFRDVAVETDKPMEQNTQTDPLTEEQERDL